MTGSVAFSADHAKKPAAEATQSQKPAQYQRTTQLPFVFGNKQQSSAQNKTPDYQSGYYAQSDLDAQERMATEAERLAELTDTQLSILIAEAFLLGLTLIAVGIAATAAVKIVNVTRDTGERQLRAYIHPRSPEITMHNNGKISLLVRFKNYGHTPAHDVIARITMTATLLPLNEEYLSGIERKIASQGTLGPGQEITSDLDPLVTFEPDYRTSIASGKAAIFLYGEVKYRDAFDEPRITEYRFIYTGPWGGVQGFKICPEGNEAN